MIGLKSFPKYNVNMRKTISVFTVFIFITFFLGLLLPTISYAFVIPNPLGGAFGGRITFTTPCTCTVPFSILLSIGPPKGGSFMYQPGISALYMFYSISIGPWVLGTSSGRRECLVGVAPNCTSAGFGKIIRKIGTSLW